MVHLIVALDILCGGLEAKGITELATRLLSITQGHPVLRDGTSLRKLVERTYKYRSEIAHGSILALNSELEAERAQLEGLASAMLAEYVLRLETYATERGEDDRDAFFAALTAAPNATSTV